MLLSPTGPEWMQLRKLPGYRFHPRITGGMLDTKCGVNVEESSGLTLADAAACRQNKFSRYLPDSDDIGNFKRNTYFIEIVLCNNPSLSYFFYFFAVFNHFTVYFGIFYLEVLVQF